jgi:hypothetical protein
MPVRNEPHIGAVAEHGSRLTHVGASVLFLSAKKAGTKNSSRLMTLYISPTANYRQH